MTDKMPERLGAYERLKEFNWKVKSDEQQKFYSKSEAIRLIEEAEAALREKMDCGHPSGCRKMGHIGRPGGKFRPVESCLACLAAVEAKIELLTFLCQQHIVEHKDSNFRIQTLDPLRKEYLEDRRNLFKDRDGK